MLTFGTVAFSVTEAAYQTLRRASRYRVPALERVGTELAYQYTGPGEESITLAGAIMPTYRGRPGVLDDLRALAAAGESRLLTSGNGEAFGRWVIEEVSEERSGLFNNGAARKIEFTLNLLRDDGSPRGLQTRLMNAAATTGSTAAALDRMGTAVDAGEDAAGVIAAAQGAA